MADGEDKKQLKFIEILLVVGGIIGGVGYKNEDSSIRVLLALFLISSLMYYYVISDPDQSYRKINRRVFADFTSVFFSVLIIYPMMLTTPALISFWGSNYPKFNAIINFIGAIILSILIFINLQEKSEVESWKILNFLFIIIINAILIWMIFIWLEGSL
jgi:hypothetical protein